MTKHQLVLLVLLVSFITALVTGIVTVTLINQAPQPITQTIQRVIEKTIGALPEPLQKDEKKEFEPMPSPLCNWCAFKPMCPAWKHLYRNTNNESGIANKDEADVVLKEFFALRKEVKVDEDKISELQKKIREYMDSQGLTRVFSDDGTVSKKTIQRFSYDFEKIKALLSPIGRWEDILDADEAKLKKISKELPPEIRSQIEDARRVSAGEGRPALERAGVRARGPLRVQPRDARPLVEGPTEGDRPGGRHRPAPALRRVRLLAVDLRA